ncbi:MAG: CotH kinase family protein [Prevotella sp.]|nr:CotH kinase family protein [Prevotella sp.]
MRRYIYIMFCFLAINYYLPTLALDENNNTITSDDNPAIADDNIVIAGDTAVDIHYFINDNLPLIEINTVGGEEPTFDPADPPEGCIGNSITNATKVPGRMYIIVGSDTLYDSGEYEKDESGLTIKIRGNSSARFADKKPYKLKLQKKADLLFRGNDSIYKDKEWILNVDETNLTNNMVGVEVSKQMNFAWIPTCTYVNVVINGTYRGIYYLSESVKRDSKCRIDVEKETGYIIENDPYYWNEDLYFNSSFVYNYTFKYPESEDVSEEQLEYIQTVMDSAEASLDDGTYPDYIDVNTFANWVLTHDLLGTSDGAGSNMFLSKYDNTASSKIKMETPWDFDTIERTTDTWSTVHETIGFFYCKLFGNANPEFTKEYIKAWKEKRDTVVDKIIEKMDSLEHSELAASLDYYSGIDKKVDYLNYDSISIQIEEHKQWFIDRKAWLDAAIAELEKETGILPAPYCYPAGSDAIYDLQGRRVLHPTKGVYIKGGKKYILK